MFSVTPETSPVPCDGGDAVYATTGMQRKRNTKRRASPNYGDDRNHAYDRLHTPPRTTSGSPPRRQATDPLPHPCVSWPPSRSPSSTDPGVPAAADTHPTGTPALQPLSNGIALRPNDAYHNAESSTDTPSARAPPRAADHAIAPRVPRARYVHTTARLRRQDAHEEPDVLAQQPYFHGTIDRAEAERRLRQLCDTDPGARANPDGRFLVREKRPDGPGTRTSYVMTVVFRCEKKGKIMVAHHLAQRARRTDGCQGNHFIVDGKIRISGHRSMVSLVAELIADPNAAHAAAISGRSTPLLSTACPKPPAL